MKTSTLRKILLFIIICFFVLATLLISGFEYYRNRTVQTLEVSKSPHHIIDIDNQRTNEELVTIDEVPDHLVSATLIAEDPDFRNRSKARRFDCFVNPIRFMFNPRQFKNIDGISLTTALLRQTDQQNFDGNHLKFYLTECILVSHLEGIYNKDQIVEIYLNEIYYLPDDKGLRYVTAVLFDKEPEALTLAEATLIASLAQAPGLYSPYEENTTEDGTPRWRVRAEYILEKMYENQLITRSDYGNAKSELDQISFDY